MRFCPCAAVTIAAVAGCSQRNEQPAHSSKAAATDDPALPKPPPIDKRLDPSAARTRLFAADVPTGTLALSIGIETIGRTNSIMFPRGTPLPARRTEMFSTGADDQAAVEIHVVEGERPNVADNHTLGRFQLTGIPPAPRAVPQIDVTFAIDEHGILEVSARDRATGATRAMQVEAGAGGALNQRGIDELIADARTHAAEDTATRERMQQRLDLETLAYSTGRLVTDGGAKLPADLRDRCLRELQRVQELLARPAPSSAELIAATTSLRTAAHDATGYLYAHAPTP